MSTLYLALGSNLGDRAGLIRRALELVADRIGPVTARSRDYETRPMGFTSPHPFLNAAACVETNLPVDEVLSRTQQIERELGREHKTAPGGTYTDRPIDLDLLLYGTTTCHGPQLTLPHPHLHERRFVLEPLAEIAPDVVVPTLGLTVRALLGQLNQGDITRLTPSLATAETLSPLNALLTQLSASASPLTAEALQTLGAQPDSYVYLLRDEESLLCATATLVVAHQLTGAKAWVEDVVVDSSCRGRGYARQLLAHIESEALRLGLKALNLTSRPARTAANRLYQSEGYALRETNVYRKPLTGSCPA